MVVRCMCVRLGGILLNMKWLVFFGEVDCDCFFCVSMIFVVVVLI